MLFDKRNWCLNFGVFIVMFLTLMVGMIFPALANEQGYEAFRPAREDEVEDATGFASLQEVNPDVFGWISVFGTNIDYPLVQDQNNDNRRYEHTNARGEPSMSGAIFLDVRNEQDLTNFIHIIYGHEMGRNAMFGELTQFANEEVFNRHTHGMIYTATEDTFYGVEFFAFMMVNAFDGTFYNPHMIDEQEKEYFLQRLENEAIHYRNIGVGIHERLVILSTCTPTSNDMRQVLIGRLTTDVLDDVFYNDTRQGWINRILDDIGEFGLATTSILVVLLTVLSTILIAKLQIKKEIKAATSTPPKKKTKRATMLQEFFRLSGKIAIILSALILAFIFIFGVTQVTDASMAPSVREGDLIFFQRRGNAVGIGDMVVVNFRGETQIRRVIAVAGDVVDINYEGLVVNGRVQQEMRIFEETTPFIEGVRFPIVLDEGEVFLLGDSRGSAEDSRIYGAVEVDNIIGTVITVLRRRNL